VRFALGIALAAFAAVQAFAETPTSDLRDTSFRAADGTRVQQLEVTVNASVAKVWAAFTTDKGFESWAAPVAHVTPGNDGMIEASYSMHAKIGDPDNIRNRIVVYYPEHLLVLHNEHVPQGAPFKPDAIDKIRTIIRFEDLRDGRTRVIETGVGYGEGPDFDSMYDHFRAGNAEEFNALAQSFVTGPVDWKAEVAKAQASVNAEKAE
jgi:uncharacterized protein YndB with AHSA1/START domain